jgi:group II intron maturase
VEPVLGPRKSADPGADDCNIYVRSRRTGDRVMASVEQFLTSRLKLKVNTAKSALARPNARKFLGFSFTSETAPRRRIAPQALARFASRVRQLTRRQSGRNLEQTIAQLSVCLTGWRGYFGFCQTTSVLRDLDGWVRRRLPRLAPTRDQPAAGGHHGRCGTRPWPVAAQPASRRPGRLARDLLRRAWPANPGAGRRMTPPPNRRGRTRMHGGVGGVEPRGFPLSRLFQRPVFMVPSCLGAFGPGNDNRFRAKRRQRAVRNAHPKPPCYLPQTR